MILRLLLLALLSGGLVASPMVFDLDQTYADTKKKKGLKKRSAYTSEQREKILENARKICKKKYGAPSSVYRIDYNTGTIWCNQN